MGIHAVALPAPSLLTSPSMELRIWVANEIESSDNLFTSQNGKQLMFKDHELRYQVVNSLSVPRRRHCGSAGSWDCCIYLYYLYDYILLA